MMTLPSAHSTAGAANEALINAGFTPTTRSHQHGDIRLAIGAQWCVLESPLVATDSSTEPGSRGLWKRIRVDAESRRVFALPRSVWDAAITTDISLESQTTVIEQCLQWVLVTAGQGTLPGWQSPSRAVVESWFKPDQLTVVAGPLVRQGELLCEPDQLAIRFPLVPEVPPNLPEPRRAWLRALIHEAQDRWHLVRLGFVNDGDGQSSIIAEVDLTGVPHELAEDLFVISLEALRWVVQWLGETTDWLADVTVASELLAVCPDTNQQEGVTP